MNPYAAHLGDRPALEVLAATPRALTTLVDKLGPHGLERSLAPGKWSVRFILSHLADCELVFAYRMRQALAEPHHVIQPFDQESWARPYASFDALAALEVFSAVRRWNLTLIGATPAGALSKRISHPERGELTFQEQIETMAGHDLNHLRQLETIGSQTNASQ